MNVEQLQEQLRKTLSASLGEKSSVVNRASLEAAVTAYLEGLKLRGELPGLGPVVHLAASYEVDGKILTWVDKNGFRWTEEDQHFEDRAAALTYAARTLQDSIVIYIERPQL